MSQVWELSQKQNAGSGGRMFWTIGGCVSGPNGMGSRPTWPNVVAAIPILCLQKTMMR